MTAAGTTLIAAGSVLIVAVVTYLVIRNRKSRARRHSRGIEIYHPSLDPHVERGLNGTFIERKPFGGTFAHSRTSPAKGGAVLVTGASKPSGVAAVRTLVAAGYEVVAVDHDPLAAGFRLAHFGAVVPLSSAPDFGVTLAKVASRVGARALIPGDGIEIEALQRSTEVLSEAGVDTWLPDPEVVATCSDRWRLHESLVAFGHPVPETGLDSASGIPGPWSVSPRFVDCRDATFTSGSLAAVKLRVGQLPGAVVSHDPRGRRFEADVLADRSGTVIAAVPHWQLHTSGDVTTAAQTFDRDGVTSVVKALCMSMKLQGPATVTGVVSEDHGVVVTNFSLGFSACTPLCAAAGANLVVEYAKAVRGDVLPDGPMPYRSGVRMVRHLDEVFET